MDFLTGIGVWFYELVMGMFTYNAGAVMAIPFMARIVLTVLLIILFVVGLVKKLVKLMFFAGLLFFIYMTLSGMGII